MNEALGKEKQFKNFFANVESYLRQHVRTFPGSYASSVIYFLFMQLSPRHEVQIFFELQGSHSDLGHLRLLCCRLRIETCLGAF